MHAQPSGGADRLTSDSLGDPGRPITGGLDGLTQNKYVAGEIDTDACQLAKQIRAAESSGLTTVAFPGQGGGLPAGEWTIASILKQAGYSTCQIGKWHLGEADYSMPTEHGFDEMHNTTLYHLNAYTYTDPAFNPDFPFDDKEMMATWGKRHRCHRGQGWGEKWTEVEKINSSNIPFLDEKSVKHATDYLQAHARDKDPFFLYLNTAKLHQPNLPHPDFAGKSMAKSKYLDSLVELDYRVGVVMDKVRELGIGEDTLVIWTTDNGAWQDVYPDCGYTPFRGTKGTDYEGGSRVPAIAWWPGTIEPGRRNSEIVGSLDFMATFASLAGVTLPTEDREGKPTTFDSLDQTAVLTGTGPPTRDTWYYMIETEDSPERSGSGSGRRCGIFGRAGRVLPSTWLRGPSSTICGRTRRSATTSS